MGHQNEDLISRLGAAALDCRAAVREAHEATRDLRIAKRELDARTSSARSFARFEAQPLPDSIL